MFGQAEISVGEAAQSSSVQAGVGEMPLWWKLALRIAERATSRR
ncbi:hypothetical protein JMV73_01065 [Klebsiella pneumoniae]|nr:hypothetical protein JMV73_01065 [Klebsiella pneumoniae]